MREGRDFGPPGAGMLLPSGNSTMQPGSVAHLGGGGNNVVLQTQRAYSLYVVRAGLAHSIELIRYIEATGLVSGSLVVRLQKKGSWPSGATFVVRLQNVSPAPDDPATLYTDNTSVAAVSFTDTESAPLLKTDDLSGTIAGYIRCILTAETSNIDGQMDFTVGINVVERNG